MAKRVQEQKENDMVADKSKPTTMNLTSTVSTSSSSVNHPIASKSFGILKSSTGKPDARARRNSKPDAASSSQGRLKDAYLGGLMVEVAVKPVATDKSQESWDFPECESWSDNEKEVTGKLVASRRSGISGNYKAGSKNWPHNFHMSPAAVPHMDRFYSIVRQIYGRSPMDGLSDFDVNNALWIMPSPSCSSSWSRLYGESTIYQDSTVKKLVQVTERMTRFRQTSVV